MILVAIRIFSIVMEACKVVRQGIANEISVQTMRQAVNSATLKACVKKEKPLLSHKNIQAHFDLAKSHKNWTLVDWKQVVFHMRLRSIILLLRSLCWAQDGEGLTNQIVGKTPQHGRSSIMVWSCMNAIRPKLICKIENICSLKRFHACLIIHFMCWQCLYTQKIQTPTQFCEKDCLVVR